MSHKWMKTHKLYHITVIVRHDLGGCEVEFLSRLPYIILTNTRNIGENDVSDNVMLLN